ncbi:hypothetical protein [Sphingobacterium deserti]|uniref:Uncharacterized protein n=1 Tax=Sphingobacterium deserti TaxID=1229276 RepID=A0A0B8T5T7_9SPHI|nr:hypothetical protein [Sphingobacterium deserti]KGE12285.1 hypothetical protein DI53_3935 [Sphingobacterium deserti]
MQDLQGKYFELFSAAGFITARIEIRHIKQEYVPSKMYDDGSVSEAKTYTMISDNGYLWYRYDRPFTRIV